MRTIPTLLAASLLLSGCIHRASTDDKGRMTGSDRDEHGCIASAGYIWSRAAGRCIRLFEQGIRLESPRDGSPAFLVVGDDSSHIEIFLDDGQTAIASRQAADNRTPRRWRTDDGKTEVTHGHTWDISENGILMYRQPDSTLGAVVTEIFSGSAADTAHYRLAVRHREHSGDGGFTLTITRGSGPRHDTTTYTGLRFTLRGTPDDNDATVWQARSDDGPTFEFLCSGDTLSLLGTHPSDGTTPAGIVLTKEP